MEQFALALLAGFGIAPVPGAVSFLLRWASFEGTYLAAWNPLNTMYPAHDGNRWNPQGVAAYDTLEEGVNATIRTLEDDDRYQPIIRTLETGDVTPATIAALRVWGTGSPAGAYSFADTLESELTVTQPSKPTRAEMLLAGYGIRAEDGHEMKGEVAIAYAYEAQWSAFLAIRQLQDRLASLEQQVLDLRPSTG